MAGLAIGHLAAPEIVDSPRIIGLDAGRFHGLVCAAASFGLPFRRVRGWVAVGLLLAITYIVSARRLAGTLGPDAFALAPIAIAALIV